MRGKTLKAFLVGAGIHVERTHYLPRLLELCRGADGSFDDLVADATSLTDYAVSARYPDVEPDPSVEEAEAATAASERVLDFVRARFAR
jgi:HEPN domain-containing protein